VAALITAGAKGEKQSVTVTGEVRINVSGNFRDSASVIIEVDGDSLGNAIAKTFFKPGGIRLGTVNNDVVTATISGGTDATAIGVSVTAV
jgi:hypothetical protein